MLIKKKLPLGPLLAALLMIPAMGFHFNDAQAGSIRTKSVGKSNVVGKRSIGKGSGFQQTSRSLKPRSIRRSGVGRSQRIKASRIRVRSTAAKKIRRPRVRRARQNFRRANIRIPKILRGRGAAFSNNPRRSVQRPQSSRGNNTIVKQQRPKELKKDNAEIPQSNLAKGVDLNDNWTFLPLGY